MDHFGTKSPFWSKLTPEISQVMSPDSNENQKLLKRVKKMSLNYAEVIISGKTSM